MKKYGITSFRGGLGACTFFLVVFFYTSLVYCEKIKTQSLTIDDAYSILTSSDHFWTNYYFRPDLAVKKFFYYMRYKEREDIIISFFDKNVVRDKNKLTLKFKKYHDEFVHLNYGDNSKYYYFVDFNEKSNSILICEK